jgi:hypothetical protein
MRSGDDEGISRSGYAQPTSVAGAIGLYSIFDLLREVVRFAHLGHL